MSSFTNRRRFLAFLSSVGLLGTAFPRALWGLARQEKAVTKEMISAAEALSGLSFTSEEREMMVRGLGRNRQQFVRLRKIPVGPEVSPALVFLPDHGHGESVVRRGTLPVVASAPKISSETDLAFATVGELGALLRARKVTAVDLARLSLKRLKAFDPKLKCVITLTEKLALEQAARADKELAAGKIRGPLHGIPWGAKDLLDTKGIATTWGAEPFKDRIATEDATVVQKLAAAGAVLTAKLTLGALAMGDQWFGGRTRNPWNPEQGSSGSSAGPAAAVAAGLLPFAIGSETLGSIVSPCTRCGATGLRPTFGRVSRHGAMALSWTMDKIGPIARSAEDCALVLDAISGADGRDDTALDRALDWDFEARIKDLRFGLVEASGGSNAAYEAVLKKLRGLGARLKPVKLPDYRSRDLMIILHAEAACAFDDITRDGQVQKLVAQNPRSWPNSFRRARFIPAVEYLRASRVRTLVMKEMARVMDGLDVLVAPGRSTLTVTNLTGHPAVVMPNGFREGIGTPTSITFVGSLFGEAKLVAAAAAWQAATGFHKKRPPLTG